MVFLGEAKRLLGKGQRLLAVRRLQHGDLGRDGVVAGVLLVLGREHAGVIRHADDEARLDALIGNGKQRVRCHVQAHVLHAAGRAHAPQGGPVGHLQGDLFIGRPLAVDLRVFGGFFGDLRAGGAGVAGDHAAPGFV